MARRLRLPYLAETPDDDMETHPVRVQLGSDNTLFGARSVRSGRPTRACRTRPAHRGDCLEEADKCGVAPDLNVWSHPALLG